MSAKKEKRDGLQGGATTPVIHRRDKEGVFAGRAIKQGAVFFCEKPLVFVPNAFGMMYPNSVLKTLFDQFSLNEELLNAGCKDLTFFLTCEVLRRTKRAPVDQKLKQLVHSMVKNPNIQKHFDSAFVSKIAGIARCTRNEVEETIAKVLTHGFNVTGRLFECSTGWALYEHVAFLNHSCEPNTYLYFKLDGSAVLQAISDISEGQEIRYAYMKGREYSPVGIRRRNLLLTSGFDCICTRCVTESEVRIPPAMFSEPRRAPVAVSDAGRDQFAGMVASVVSSTNAIIRNHSRHPFEITERDYSDSSVVQIFREGFGFVPSHPASLRHTAVLMRLLLHMNISLDHFSNLQEAVDLLKIAYPVLLKTDELFALPISVAHFVVSQALPVAVLAAGGLGEAFSELIHRLVKEGPIERDFRLHMLYQAFAYTLLGKNLEPLSEIESQFRKTRVMWSRDILEIDCATAPCLNDIVVENRAAVEEYLRMLKKRTHNKKKRLRAKKKAGGRDTSTEAEDLEEPSGAQDSPVKDLVTEDSASQAGEIAAVATAKDALDERTPSPSPIDGDDSVSPKMVEIEDDAAVSGDTSPALHEKEAGDSDSDTEAQPTLNKRHSAGQYSTSTEQQPGSIDKLHPVGVMRDNQASNRESGTCAFCCC